MADHVSRVIDVGAEIDIWDRRLNAKTLTFNVGQRELLSYTYQKTIKNPHASATVTFTPQFAISKRHFFNHIKPLDVVRIYEFGQLKFIGFIRNMNASGMINDDGSPQRSITLTLSGMGGYLSEAKIGINAYIFGQSEEDTLNAFVNTQENFQAMIAEMVGQDNSLSYNELVNFVFDTWLNLLDEISGNTRARNLINEYFDITAGVGRFARPLWPKEWDLYQGNYEDITIWSLLDNLLDTPFNELFFDEGPRKIVINGSVVNLNAEKTHLILRNTPFNGSVSDSGSGIQNRFDSLPPILVENVVRYDLSRSMDEVYTLYTTSPPIWNLSVLETVASGFSVPDSEKFGKYLYRPLNVKLNSIRLPSRDNASLDERAQSVTDRVQGTANTLKRWFENNDAFLNGVLTINVPEDSNEDPRIGEKVELAGVAGYFYCESITHVWNYGRALTSHVGVTRGWDYVSDRPMILRGVMFEQEGGFA